MRKYSLLIIISILIACKKENVNGIILGSTFVENQTLSENKSLDTLINNTLNGDWNALRRLNHFPCGEGSGVMIKVL